MMDEDVVESPNGVVEAVDVVEAEAVIVPTPIANLSNEEFVTFPKDDNEEATVPLIVIRQSADGEIFYRLWGFPDGGQLKAILAAAAHMGGQMSDEHDMLLKRLQGVVNVAVGR